MLNTKLWKSSTWQTTFSIYALFENVVELIFDVIFIWLAIFQYYFPQNVCCAVENSLTRNLIQMIHEIIVINHNSSTISICICLLVFFCCCCCNLTFDGRIIRVQKCYLIWFYIGKTKLNNCLHTLKKKIVTELSFCVWLFCQEFEWLIFSLVWCANNDDDEKRLNWLLFFWSLLECSFGFCVIGRFVF